MMKLLTSLLRYLAFEHGKATGPYRRFCNPGGLEWASYLKRRGVFHSMGENCSIQTNVTFTDPQYMRIGNNVRLSGCIFFGHDGSVNMLKRAYGVLLDKVGPIHLKDNVFVGHGAIVLPGVTVGPNAIVAAGSVVSRDVPPNSLVGGVPAKVICDLDGYVDKLKETTESLPWFDLLKRSPAEFDPLLQVELDKIRIAHFFPSDR